MDNTHKVTNLFPHIKMLKLSPLHQMFASAHSTSTYGLLSAREEINPHTASRMQNLRTPLKIPLLTGYKIEAIVFQSLRRQAPSLAQ